MDNVYTCTYTYEATYAPAQYDQYTPLKIEQDAPINPMKSVERAFRETYGRTRVSAAVRAEMMAFIDAGITPELMERIIADCADIPRPSWAYAYRVLSNCIREDVYSLAQYEARQAAFYARKMQNNRRMITRDVKETDFDADFYSEIMSRPIKKSPAAAEE